MTKQQSKAIVPARDHGYPNGLKAIGLPAFRIIQIGVVILVAAIVCVVWRHESSNQATISEPVCIELTGAEHRWRIKYPTGLSRAETDLLQAGNDLHVPVGVQVVLILKSTDFIYTLAIPDFDLKEIAVPELEFRMTLCPTHTGEYPLIGEELCAVDEEESPGRLIVESRGEFQAWLRRKRSSM
jgi:heme/copper-type cytochrome/quinol oxidase subunit 2